MHSSNTSFELNESDSENNILKNQEEYYLEIHNYIKPTTNEWFLVFLYAVVFLVGIVGNFLVCLSIWRNKQLGTVTNMFIFNLSTADLMVIIICLPPSVVGDVTETWFLGEIPCKIITNLQV